MSIEWPMPNIADGPFRGRPVDARHGGATPKTLVHLPLTGRIRGC